MSKYEYGSYHGTAYLQIVKHSIITEIPVHMAVRRQQFECIELVADPGHSLPGLIHAIHIETAVIAEDIEVPGIVEMP